MDVTVETLGRTGVEMEALTAVTVGLLTIYDMCKAVDRAMTIEDIKLVEKSGGRSGTFRGSDGPDVGGGNLGHAGQQAAERAGSGGGHLRPG